MPYNPAQASRSVAVQRVELTLNVTPSAPWTGGDPITLTAILRKDGVAWGGQTVSFFVTKPQPIKLGEAVTNDMGIARLDTYAPKQFMCMTITLMAVHDATGTESNTISGAVAYPTRLSISAPSTVPVNQPFNITGKLEFRDIDGVWKGLAGRTVSLYYNNTKIRDVTTGSDGSYSTSATITTPGTYTLKAVYAGEGLALLAETLMTALTTPWISLLPVAVGSAAIFLVK